MELGVPHQDRAECPSRIKFESPKDGEGGKPQDEAGFSLVTYLTLSPDSQMHSPWGDTRHHR